MASPVIHQSNDVDSSVFPLCVRSCNQCTCYCHSFVGRKDNNILKDDRNKARLIKTQRLTRTCSDDTLSGRLRAHLHRSMSHSSHLDATSLRSESIQEKDFIIEELKASLLDDIHLILDRELQSTTSMKEELLLQASLIKSLQEQVAGLSATVAMLSDSNNSTQSLIIKAPILQPEKLHDHEEERDTESIMPLREQNQRVNRSDSIDSLLNAIDSNVSSPAPVKNIRTLKWRGVKEKDQNAISTDVQNNKANEDSSPKSLFLFDGKQLDEVMDDGLLHASPSHVQTPDVSSKYDSDEEIGDDESDEGCSEDVLSKTKSVNFSKECTKSGYLQKSGGSMAAWRRRYFVLQDSQLFYYKSQFDIATGTPPLGHILVLDSAGADAVAGRGHRFEIVTTERRYLLVAESEYEQNEWISLINRVVSRESRQTRPAKSSTAKRCKRANSFFKIQRSASAPNASVSYLAEQNPSALVRDTLKATLSGFLTKRGSANSRSWKRRWFVLQPESIEHLRYYKDETHRELMGTIVLTDCESMTDITLITQSSDIPQSSSNVDTTATFQLRTVQRTYFLVAESLEEANHWVEVLRSTINEIIEKRVSTPAHPLANNEIIESESNVLKIERNECLRKSVSSSLEERDSCENTADVTSNMNAISSDPKLSKKGWIYVKGIRSGQSMNGKQKRFLTGSNSWRKRWFVSRDTPLPMSNIDTLVSAQLVDADCTSTESLVCFYKNSQESDLIGVLNLSQATSIEKYKHSRHNYTFCITFVNGIHANLMTDTLSDCTDWMEIFRELGGASTEKENRSYQKTLIHRSLSNCSFVSDISGESELVRFHGSISESQTQRAEDNDGNEKGKGKQRD